MNAKYKTSIKGKIIAAFLLCLAALIGSYFVNKYAFREIQDSVKDLAYTNKKLIIVNNVFFEVNELDKSFRNMVTTDSSLDTFTVQSPRLRQYSDSLRSLCAGNAYQIALIDSLTQLFDTREKLLVEYIGFRRKIRKNNTVLQQAATLDSLISTDHPQVDSQIYSNEASESTIKIDTITTPKESVSKKGLWQKLFKAQNKEAPEISKTINQKVIETKIDTIVIQTRQNSIKEEAQKIIDAIGKEQTLRRKNFLNKEIALNQFENSFHNKITDLLSEIEKDITRQTGLTRNNAEKNIDGSMNRVFVIIASFFFFAVIIMFLMLTDVTKSNKYRQLLEQARKDAERQSLSWKRFLSNMSHEIRTPLQAVIGYSEQMELDTKPDMTHVKIIQDASRHLLQVINEILDYNKIISGSFTFEKQVFHIAEVVAEVIAILKHQADRKGIQLLSSHDTLPKDELLTGDAFRLKQVLLNLAGNAVKFTRSGSVEIKVTQCPSGDKAQYIFSVSDTGPGIPYEMQETIFNQFEQVNLPAEQRYKGTGLGLSIVKALVEGQGGSISLESRPGEGSSFTFRITYEKATTPVIAEKDLRAFTPPEGTIWLVDDDRFIVQLCRIIFEQNNISYRCFYTAASLLEMGSSEVPSVILMDIRMPDMNGFQLIEAVQKRYAAQIAVIALTAQALPAEQREILAHGFDGILLKPFLQKDLLSLLQHHTKAAYDVDPAADKKIFDDTLSATVSAFEDEEAIILRHYIMETASDIALLQSAIEENHIHDTVMLLHRIAGRTAQIGEKKTGRMFRELEISLQRNAIIDTERIGQAIIAIKTFISNLSSTPYSINR